MQKITPFLWFDNNIEEAIEFYTEVFKNTTVGNINHIPGVEKAFSATFELEGQKFMALNGGPMFKFTEAISFFVSCDNQQEIDYYWEKLISGGGSESRCGWLKDKFGLSWQVVPANLSQLLYNKDPKKAQKVMAELMKMNKLDIATLKAAGE